MEFIDPASVGQNGNKVVVLIRKKIVLPKTRNIEDDFVCTNCSGLEARFFFALLKKSGYGNPVIVGFFFSLGIKGVVRGNTGKAKPMSKSCRGC